MKTFKQLFFESIKSHKFKRGADFGMIGAGKAGPIKSKKDKLNSPKKQRQDWKKQSKDYY